VCVLLETCRPCPRWWGLRPLLGADVPAGLVHVSDLKPPGWHIVGLGGPAVVVPARVAAWLESKLDLRRVRTDVRGADPEVDAVLLDLAVVALTWRKAVEALPCRGSEQAGPAEAGTPSSWLTTAQAAGRLGVTSSRVRRRSGPSIWSPSRSTTSGGSTASTSNTTKPHVRPETGENRGHVHANPASHAQRGQPHPG
jgi:hypothetical protein